MTDQPPDVPAADGSAAGEAALTIRAERALLGAVMSDPAGQGPILDTVQPGDMYRPYHGQVLAAMQRLRARGEQPGPLAVRAELARDPDLPQSIALDGVPLADLLAAAPRTGHAPAYAAMVIDYGIRQDIRLAGSRMTQTAETLDADAAARMAAQASRAVEDCQQRWATLPEQMRRELPAATGQRARQHEEAAWQLRAAGEEIARARREAQDGDGARLAGRLAGIAQRVTAAAAATMPAGHASLRAVTEARPSGPDAEADGLQFLRDLAAGPGQVTAVREWLSPADFARPAHGQVFALIRDMHAARKPVDPVTIAWEAARRGIPADAAELEGGTAAFAVADAREVARHGLLARIGKAGHDISAAAADRQKPLGVLLRDAAERLRELERGPPGRRAGRQPKEDQVSAAEPAVRGTRRATGRPRGRSPAQQADSTAEHG